MAGVKPAVAMRTLSVRFRSVVIGVIAIVAVVSCCNFASIRDARISSYSVEIRRQRAPTYVEWKDEGKFKTALAQVRAHNGEYCFCVIRRPGDDPHPYDSHNKCPRGYTCPPGDIKTVKVIKSKAADNIAAGESAVNDPHVTYRVQSPDPGDIAAVLDALEK